MNDYTICYKEQLPIEGTWNDTWDVFISAYVPGDRTERVFLKANAPNKWWLLFPEYRYSEADRPVGQVFHENITDEAAFIAEFWNKLPATVESSRICIDITGFIRPYLMFLIRWLVERGVRQITALYAEPIQYSRRELTEFSGTVVKEVRQVAGFEGSHSTDISNDVLIIGSGYEDHLIKHVAENKKMARKLQIIGFPSLRADMYQENVLRIQRAEESLGGCVDDETHAYFAPANDPFVTAAQLQGICEHLRKRKQITNLYLCPLSTKAHVLGFTLFYLWECRRTPASMVFPFEEAYSKDASMGIARLWKYVVELPAK
jgi:hypothetical protein